MTTIQEDSEPPSALLSEKRFYPESIPVFPNEPTRDRFEIRRDPMYGEGVASLVRFRKGSVVFSFTGFFVSEVTQFSLQISENLHLHDPYFYGKILHSCAPNTHVDLQTRQFIADRNIRPGEHVTMDYAQTEDYLFRTFPCGCGASNCRRFVTGRKQAPLTAVQDIPHVAVPLDNNRKRSPARSRKVASRQAIRS